MARVLDGAAIAAEIKAEVAEEVKLLAAQGIRPGLAAVLVGHVPASEIYVRSKVKTCGELGLFSEMIEPPESVTTEEMLALVAQLNARDDIDGILIQLPLPAHVDAKLLLDSNPAVRAEAQQVDVELKALAAQPVSELTSLGKQ